MHTTRILAAATALTAVAAFSPATAANAWAGSTAAHAGPSQAVAAAKPIATKTYRGSGDDVIRVQSTKLPGIATFRHNGESNFIVTPIDRNGEDGMSLVNEIGPYAGTVAFNVDYYSTAGISGLTINADGDWAVTIRPLSAAKKWNGAKATGTGDTVLRLSPATSTRGLHTVAARHNGDSNFIVCPIINGHEGSSMINEIGAYHGKVRLPNRTQYVTVLADGGWNFVRQ